MDLHGAADPSDGTCSCAPLLDGFYGRLFDLGMIGEAEVVVAGEVDDLLAVHHDPATGRRLEDLGDLVQVLVLELLEIVPEPSLEVGVHGLILAPSPVAAGAICCEERVRTASNGRGGWG